MEPSSAYVSDFMSFVVKKLPPAEQDALEAAIWYEERQPGLGEEFLSEIDRAVQALRKSALFHRIRFADVRRGRRYICSSFMESITSSTNKKSGYWQSFMGDGIRGGWKNGANKFDKLVCARRTRHLCLTVDLRFV